MMNTTARIRTCVLTLAAGFAVATTAAAQHEQHAPQAPDHMAHRFDDAEAYAKRFDDPARDAWQMPDRVIAALALTPGMSIADIGAGTGYFAVRLAKTAAAPTVYGADIEPNMVDHMKARAMRERLSNLVPVLAASDSPNLPTPVDLVLIVDTYHHIGSRAAYFRRLRESMTPQARLVIIDFRKESPEGPPVEFRFEPEQITSELREAGFTLAASHDFLPRQHFLVYTAAGK
jgi:cyclopropane fatty-acyl-phospholipid synthase-like methyltransferase